ncbi:MAG: ATP-binding protein [Proteobacteria bacterium]|nr:ATP-binding protein [Pseudomonadota bacterium]
MSASANYLSLAVKNLLLNAAKHSAAGSTVTLEFTQVGQDVIFKVVDHGEGIPAESLPYVFDPFYRADTARNRASGGAGVGLSLTKAMVSLHAGTIDVASTFGQGATFTIHLPVQQA